MSKLTLVIMLLSGCAMMEVDGFRVRKNDTLSAFKTVQNRAKFDFSCTESEIKTSVLSIHNAAYGAFVSQIGASGCGHKAVYVLVMNTANGTEQWVMNSVADKKD